MKKATLLFALLFISTIGFSQNKSSGFKLSNINLKIKTTINNPENNPLIDEINKLSLEYLNLKAREFQYDFGNQDLSKFKTKDEILKAYIVHIKKVTESDKVQMLKKYGDGDLLKHFSVPRVKKLDNKIELKSGKKTNVRDAHDKY